MGVPDLRGGGALRAPLGPTETLTGEARGLLPGGDDPPPPDSTYKEGGAYGEFAAALRRAPGVGAEARGGGRRRARPADRAAAGA